MAKIGIVIVSFVIIFSSSLCEISIPDKNFNTKSLQKAVSLSPELPFIIKQLSPVDTDKKKIIEDLKGIIGFLPPSEQLLLLDLFKDDKSNDPLFDYVKYKGSLETNGFFEDQITSLSEVLSANAKRFRSGLGCIQKVTDYFHRFSSEDDTIVENIYTNISNLLQASNQLNHCEMNFMKVLYTIVNKRKALLTEITKTNYDDSKASTADKDLFTYEDGKIKGINYEEDDAKGIVKEFMNYATCHQAFNNVVHTKGMEIMISITQMKNCLDEEKPNKNAGRSSSEYSNPSINYRGDQSIGINNAEGIRTDRRTQNNYLLDKGYRYGRINTDLNSNDVPKMEIPNEWKTKLNTLRQLAGAADFKLTQLNQRLEKATETQRAFSDLGNFLISTLTTNPLTAFDLLLESKCGVNDAYSFECTNNCNKGKWPATDPIDIAAFEMTPKDYNKLYGIPPDSSIYNYNFIITEPLLAVICDKGKFKIYSEGTHSSLGKVYDYIESGISLGSVIGNINQSCFGVFTSGGKNDKDACRDTINKECGSELDYRCKESGLYDVITQNPPAKTILPQECMMTPPSTGPDKFKCFNWIAKHFILGSLSIKPSAFLSYSLAAQNKANNGKSDDNINYFTSITSFMSLVDPQEGKVAAFNAIVSKAASSFYVEDNTAGKFTTDGYLMSQVSRTAYIQTVTSQTIRISFLSILSFSLMIIFS